MTRRAIVFALLSLAATLRGAELPRAVERKLENSEGAPRLPSFCGSEARAYGARSAYISAAVSCAAFPGRGRAIARL